MKRLQRGKIPQRKKDEDVVPKTPSFFGGGVTPGGDCSLIIFVLRGKGKGGKGYLEGKGRWGMRHCTVSALSV